MKSKVELIAFLYATIHEVCEKTKIVYSIFRVDNTISIKLGDPIRPQKKVLVVLDHKDFPNHIAAICAEINTLT